MTRCKRCGSDAFPNKFVCTPCLKKFTERRTLAYEQTKTELGEFCNSNSVQFIKRVRQIEKQLAMEDKKQEIHN